MTVNVQPVTKENYEEVCDLDVSDDQQEFVAGNTWSLVESLFEGYDSRAIYVDKDVVGFLMWVQETKNKISIWRFMIDIKFQNQGYGRKALELAIEEIKSDENLQQIEICYNPKNPVANDFYSSFGFVEVGMDNDNEDMLAIINL